jgi:hypothetical protein
MILLFRDCLKTKNLWGGVSLESFIQAVANVGFPIVVTAYLLVRIESKLEGLTASIAELARAVDTFQE